MTDKLVEALERDVEWLDRFGRSVHCTVEDNDTIQRVVAFARRALSSRPAGEAVGGWIISNGQDDRYRTWKDGYSAWTDSREEATRYARREDAEAVHQFDEDAWHVKPYDTAHPPAAVAGEGEDARYLLYCKLMERLGKAKLTNAVIDDIIRLGWQAPTALSQPAADALGTGDAEKCARCGHQNPPWRTPSPLWNAVMRGGCIDGEPIFNDMVCAACFMSLAEEAGIARNFRVVADDVSATLQTATPSGRV
ncbi:MAG: hypothetical protein WBL20_08060, partial [Sphingobium sp.]